MRASKQKAKIEATKTKSKQADKCHEFLLLTKRDQPTKRTNASTTDARMEASEFERKQASQNGRKQAEANCKNASN